MPPCAHAQSPKSLCSDSRKEQVSSDSMRKVFLVADSSEEYKINQLVGLLPREAIFEKKWTMIEGAASNFI